MPEPTLKVAGPSGALLVVHFLRLQGSFEKDEGVAKMAK
jgi:hypothetical protein